MYTYKFFISCYRYWGIGEMRERESLITLVLSMLIVDFNSCIFEKKMVKIMTDKQTNREREREREGERERERERKSGRE